jgi:hypothetical protein
LVIVSGNFAVLLGGQTRLPVPLPHFPLASIGTRSAKPRYQLQRTSGKPNRTEQLLVKMIVSVTQFGGGAVENGSHYGGIVHKISMMLLLIFGEMSL